MKKINCFLGVEKGSNYQQFQRAHVSQSALYYNSTFVSDVVTEQNSSKQIASQKCIHVIDKLLLDFVYNKYIVKIVRVDVQWLISFCYLFLFFFLPLQETS